MNANSLARRIARRISYLLLSICCLTSPALIAQSPVGSATITGRVVDTQGSPVTDATITILELRRSVRAAADGSYRFANVPPGHYHVQAESRRYGTSIGEAEIAAGAVRQVEIIIDPLMHSEEIVVTAGPDSRRATEVQQPVSVVTAQELAERLQPTLGETLNEEPGITSTYFGPGSSRPVIRGLGADRIRLLEGGVGTGDVSNISPDHAVSVEPSVAEQIEIVRGPATLLYGSNAVGGVVNVISERIPTRVPGEVIGGTLDLRLGTVADERTGTLNLQGGRGRFAWHFDAVARNTDDYDIPGPADRFDDEPEELTGVLENSALRSRSGTLGGSYITDRGFFGIAVNSFSSRYGVPGHAHHEEEEEAADEESLQIDLDQRRLDLRGEITTLPGFFENVRARVGVNDYEHVELEGEEIGTRFTNDAWEGRLEARHRPFGALRGTFGVQLAQSDFVAVGEEAFIAPNQTSTRAIFAFEEATWSRWDFQFGARFESQDIDVDAGLPDRSFDGISLSTGALFRPVDGWAVAVSLARATRLPTATELYANGPHLATRQFEIGDVDLREETSLGLDLSLRRTLGKVRGELNLFQNTFAGYIFDAPTGEEEDELPVFAYIQEDATFRGLELSTHTELWHEGERHLEIEVGGDLVRASLDGGGNLPRIPPFRAFVAVRYQGGPWSARTELRRVASQNRVAVLEEPTAGYTMVNAHLGYRFLLENTIHDILLRGTNLTDELARSHPSPLKEVAPLPGRDLTLSYRITF